MFVHLTHLRLPEKMLHGRPIFVVVFGGVVVGSADGGDSSSKIRAVSNDTSKMVGKWLAFVFVQFSK